VLPTTGAHPAAFAFLEGKAMDDDDIEDMIRNLIESGTAWTNENRKAVLGWLRQVSISHQAAVQIMAQSEATMRSAGFKSQVSREAVDAPNARTISDVGRCGIMHQRHCWLADQVENHTRQFGPQGLDGFRLRDERYVIVLGHPDRRLRIVFGADSNDHA
jgi:hypothetical protein